MGICASCLGGRRKDAYEENEDWRLLPDDPNSVHYGSFNDQNMNVQEDPLEVQRENEALQRVVARTSDNMVDIFEIAPQDNSSRPAPSPFAYAGQEARIVRYQHLLSRLASKEDVLAEPLLPDQGPPGVQVDWLPEDNATGVKHAAPSIKSQTDEPLVGTFADAAAAMS